MKHSSIITVPNPILKEKSKKVFSFDDELNLQIKEMSKVLRDEGGIGLAANQIGYKNQVILIEFKDPEEKNHIPLTIFINPEVVEFSKEQECFEEGCLSVPKIELEVDRPAKLKLKYQDEHGHRLKIAPKGLVARVLQHEIDHLNGILFTEKVKEQFLKKYPHFKTLKIVFCGTGEYAAIILEGLIHLGLDLNIFTEKAKPAGRDHKIQPTAVAEIAKKFGKEHIEIDEISQLSPAKYDLLICSDFGQKIPLSMLKQAKIAAINIHPSLLPKYRGPSPIQTAILHADKTTGVSIIKMTEKIDEGPIFSQIETEIMPNDDFIMLRDRLATLGLKLLVKTLPKIISNELEPVDQDEIKVIKTRKFTKEDGLINWKKSPKSIERQIRAFFPWPKTYTFIDGKRLLIHQAHLKNGQLVLDIVQLEGKNLTSFKDFLKGFRGEKPDWFKVILLT